VLQVTSTWLATLSSILSSSVGPLSNRAIFRFTDIPIFFIQDSIQFPDLVHALKPEPHNEIPQAQTAHDNAWDWMSLSPQSAAMTMWILSDRTIPRSYRMMQGFGIHTFRLVNAEGKSSFVKFHFTPELGTHSLVWDEALKLAGVSDTFSNKNIRRD
jgi:catalase